LQVYLALQLPLNRVITGRQYLSQTPWNVTEVYFYRQSTWKIAHSHFSYTRHRAPVKVEIPLPVSSSPVEYGGVLGELMTLEQAAMQRWRKGDPSGYLDLYAPDVTSFDPGSPLRVDGREAMRSIYKQLEGQISYEVMDFVDPGALSGDLAVILPLSRLG
jgi:ketosteroid isomerase-like protein